MKAVIQRKNGDKEELKLIKTPVIKEDESMTFRIKQTELVGKSTHLSTLIAIQKENTKSLCNSLSVNITIENNIVQITNDDIGLLKDIKVSIANTPIISMEHGTLNDYTIICDDKRIELKAYNNIERDIIVSLARTAFQKSYDKLSLATITSEKEKHSMKIRLSECEAIIRAQNTKIAKFEEQAFKKKPVKQGQQSHTKSKRYLKQEMEVERVMMRCNEYVRVIADLKNNVKVLENKMPIIIQNSTESKNDGMSKKRDSIDTQGSHKPSKYDALTKENKKLKIQIEQYSALFGSNGKPKQEDLMRWCNNDKLLTECQKTIADQCKRLEEYKHIIETANTKRQNTSISNYEAIINNLSREVLCKTAEIERLRKYRK